LDKEVISKPVELAGICRIEWNCEIEADTANVNYGIYCSTPNIWY
jgi:hypothetical protein